ncbi:unnamed protein product [Plutella xylostella]|uniref:(diamondback moth) hypothetical protein n=1 Tax=Plutella xylostella TaxID=51655 RepID=A0A8S4G9M6_PLUXY|nr:unnamed protein product [Plutella xylostella]
MDEQQAVRESFEDKYYQSIAKAKYLLQKHSTSARITDHSVADQTIKESQADSSEAIKYPDISLPTFSGDVSEWVEFRATYDALINQSNLKPIQKYKYLRSCLKGSALEAIGSLEFSDEGYAIAWQLLCERYNNPKILVNNHLRALFNVDKVPSNPSALRALVDNISKHLRTLKSLNEFKTFLRSRADLLETMNQLQPADHANRTSASEKAMVTTARDHSEPNKLAIENQEKYPRAADAIKRYFYYDDWIYGADDEGTVIETAKQVCNDNTELTNSQPTEFGDSQNTHKVLGLTWSNHTDRLLYLLKEHPVPEKGLTVTTARTLVLRAIELDLAVISENVFKDG